MSSLEGLNSLIQLESTRLEGAKQTSQNFQSVGSVVQQQGTQTAQSRLNMSIQRIDAEYTKECALADVRRLERKLSRERASEALTKNIACIATISNAVGNLGHLFNDLNDRQKLGDTPDYLKSPPIDPTKATVNITQQQGSAANTVYLSGSNPDGSETVYTYDTGNDGVSVSGLPLAATITEYDKERILGNDYAQMKEANGGKPLTFDQIHQKRPDLADKLVQTRGHGVSSSEAENLMTVANTAIREEQSTTSSPTTSQAQSEGSMNATRLAAVSAITNKDNPDMNASQIAEIAKIVGVSGMTDDQKIKIFGKKDPTEDEIKEKLSNTTNGKSLQKELLADPNFKQKLEQVSVSSNPTLSLAVDKIKTQGKDAKFTDKEINEMDKNLTKEDKTRIFGKENSNKPLRDLLKIDGNMDKFTKDTKIQENFTEGLKPQTTEYFVQKNENGNENVQYTDNGISFQVNDISPSEKEAILGKDDKYDFKKMSFSQIQAIKPNGQELARKLLAGSLERDFREMSGDKKLAFLKKYPETIQNQEMFSKLPEKDKEQLKKDYPKVFDGDKLNADEFSKLEPKDKDKILKEHPELFFNAQGLASLMSSDPSKAHEAVKELGSVEKSKVKSLTPQEAKDNVNKSSLMKNIATSKQSLHDSLKQHGKIDDKGTWENIKDVGKKGLNFLVTTMDQSAPYFQAYLKAKERADQTYEELQAAIDKLNAASKKLRAMELQIDAFSGRGA